MKKNITLKANGLTSSSKFFLICFLFSILSPARAVGQKVKKSITKEISISENARIKIQGPQSVNITGNGAINTRQIKDQYIVSGKHSKPYIYVIHKKLQIETWEKSNLKQVVNVVLSCENKTDTEQLLNAFEIELEENAAGNILIGCELNIDKFKIENGWFSSDDNHLILNDGKRYPIKYLELSTTLHIPMNGSIEVEAKETDITMNTHMGDTNLRISGGSFTAKELGETKAEFESVQVDIEALNIGDFKLKDCLLNLDTVSKLMVESSISNFRIKMVKNLIIEKTLSDNFDIEGLGKIAVVKSTFSNYKIGEAKESIDMIVRNGDVRVATLSEYLKFANIKNQNANVELGVQNLQNYQLNCQSVNQSKYTLPKKLTITEKSNNRKIYELGPTPEQTKIDINCSQCEVNLGHFYR